MYVHCAVQGFLPRSKRLIMKRTFTIWASILLVACGAPEEEPVHLNVSNFDWLVGEWTRTNEEPGMETHENWKKLNDSTYTAHSYTLKGKDTLWQEFTSLLPHEGGWFFRVKVPEKTASTDFRLVEADETSFICENKRNKFPKRIQYKRNDEELQAEISGGSDNVVFLFKKD